MNSLQINMLDKLVANTKLLIKQGYYQQDRQISTQSDLPSFTSVLDNSFTLLGEIKPGSPTQGKMYETTELQGKIKEIAAVIDGISVLTEPNYFHGSLENLSITSGISNYSKPILMKDFIIDQSQFENRNISAILLIERILDEQQRNELIKAAHSSDLEVILEVDNEGDFVTNLDTTADILAVNNRNLDTMQIDKEKTAVLVEQYSPERHVLGLSGYSTIDEVIDSYRRGVSGVLMGTALSKSDNPAGFINRIRREIQ